jgi:hypothetical protein
MIIVVLFQELEDLMQLKAKEHKELVDAIIINFVPMHIGNIQESFKPLLLALYPMNLPDLSE